eukprot:3502494-Pleurochrysis_carterae.AAC.1
MKLTPSSPRAGSWRRRWRVAMSTRAVGDGGTDDVVEESSERADRAGARGDETADGSEAASSLALEVDGHAAALTRVIGAMVASD